MFKISEAKKASITKAIKARMMQNRDMVKTQFILDNEYKNCIIEMARDYQVSTSVIIRVACQYFHGLLDLTDKATLKNTPLGELIDHNTCKMVIWIQKDLKELILKDSLESGVCQSRYVRAAVTEMYNGYLEASIVEASEFERTIADLIWEDKHSYENK